jgi:hypothetical protein
MTINAVLRATALVFVAIRVIFQPGFSALEQNKKKAEDFCLVASHWSVADGRHWQAFFFAPSSWWVLEVAWLAEGTEMFT